WLPPDNYQEHPVAALATRTSPTNMGLALLANLSAYDFGYIGAGRLLERTGHALDSMQALERCHGHFYNWYDTRSRKPLLPLYVSSVDSGNLAGHLLVLRAGLLALSDAPVLGPRWRDGLADTAALLEEAEESAHPELACAPPAGLADAGASLERLVERAAAIARGREAGTPAHDWAHAIERQARDTLAVLALFAPAPAAGAAIPTLRQVASGDGDAGARARARIERIEELARRAGDLADMEYGFLFDATRRQLAIGYNMSEGRRDASFYDLLASEARLANFVAIAQGKLPQESWFALGRLLTSAGGEPALLSWSGSMFEYLMPLLVMPSYEDTLLDQTCRAAVERQIAYGERRGVPWGLSESGFNAVDAALNYQYRAFGVPGLGLKRGLAEELVVAPYASALALMVAPEAACRNLRRLAAAGLEGAYGFYEAIDYTPERVPRGQDGAVVRSFMAHHQGMAFLSLGSLLHHRPMQRRFASDPRVQATMLLLQERIPRPTAFHSDTAGAFEMHSRAGAPEMPVRVLESPDTALPEVQLLSNGRYHVMVTQAGGGYSRWKDLAVTRWREDPTRDHWGSFCYLRDVASGECWSNAHQPTLAPAQGYEAIFSEARAEFRRHDHGYEAHTEIVVSPEDDVELRRLRLTNRARTRRTIETTSYAEVVLAPAAADALHPAFSNLFVQTEIVAAYQAILCTRRPRSAGEATPWMFHLVAVHGADADATSYETDRARFLGRGGTVAAPRALAGPPELSGSAGSVLDPIASVRHRIALEPDQSATLDIVTGVAETRDACLALAAKYRDRNLADRAFDLAATHNWVTLRQINAGESDARLYARLAGSILYANAALRADPAVLMRNSRGQSGLWGYAISGDLPIVLLKIADAANIELVRQLVQAHAYWRLKGLAVDLVIWNEDHAGYRQVLQEQIMGLVAAATGAHGADRPGGIFVRSSAQIGEDDRILFQSVARVIVSDRHGTLTEQVNRGAARAGTPAYPPRFKAARGPRPAPAPAQPPALPERILANPLGGFSADGTEYVVVLDAGEPT
ncbi:MAG TPA: glucoamylase family protein, partial [Myxococcota bacterium]|nr:glucoamylase family protein [Myxococcota bacterium]